VIYDFKQINQRITGHLTQTYTNTLKISIKEELMFDLNNKRYYSFLLLFMYFPPFLFSQNSQIIQ